VIYEKQEKQKAQVETRGLRKWLSMNENLIRCSSICKIFIEAVCFNPDLFEAQILRLLGTYLRPGQGCSGASGVTIGFIQEKLCWRGPTGEGQ